MLEVQRRNDRELGSPLVIARTFDDDRLELVRLLHEACEIEHSLMLQYLYAAYSLKPAYDTLVGKPEPSSQTLLGVAIQEMHHLHVVNSILIDLDAAPNLDRQGFPYEPRLYPFPMVLEPLSRASIAKYLFAEAPRGVFEPAPGFRTDASFIADLKRLFPKGVPLNHVGSLYGTALDLLAGIAKSDPRAPVERWSNAIDQIRHEGESDHYEFFRAVFLGMHPAFAGVPDPWGDPFAATYPAFATIVASATDPAALPDPLAFPTARVGNHVYWAALLLLDAGYRLRDTVGGVLHRLATTIMTDVLHPLGRALARRGLGMPFDPLTIGQSPGIAVRASLELAVDFLQSAASSLPAVAAALQADETARMRDALDTTARRARRASREGAPQALIVGAGPAGLAAATALIEQGIAVRVVEGAPIVGGKAHSLRTDRKRSEEHGVHGWWPSYLNFDRMLRRAGVVLDEALRPARGGAILTAPHTFASLKDMALQLPSPLFLVAQLVTAPYLRFSDLLSAIGFGIHALAFDHARDYGRYDVLSFATLTTRLGTSPALNKFMLHPFAMCFDYAPPEAVSAASVLSALQLYLLPSQQSIRPRWSRGLPQDTVFGPLVKSITDRGGSVDRSTIVESIEIRDQVVTGAWVVDTSAAPSKGTEVIATIEAKNIPSAGFLEVVSSAGPILVGASQGACVAYSAYSAFCPHAGGHLHWDGTRFVCDKHGGTFDAAGRVALAPTTSPLTALTVQSKGPQVEVLGSSTRKRIPCTHVIVATDVKAAQQILAASAAVPPALLERVQRLRTTPVIVVRMWFKLDTRIDDIETVVLPDSRFADVFFNLNAIDRSYDVEGLILELHCCHAREEWLHGSDETIMAMVFQDLAMLSSDLTPDRLQSADSYVILRHESVFTLYAPGDLHDRPGASTGVAGLHLAGDWTVAEWSVWMMERAVVSGLRAANRILVSHDLPPTPIERLPPEGFVLTLARTVARLLRWLLYCGAPPGDLGSTC